MKVEIDKNHWYVFMNIWNLVKYENRRNGYHMEILFLEDKDKGMKKGDYLL